MDGDFKKDSVKWVCVFKSPLPVNIEVVSTVLAENGIESFTSDRRDSVYTFLGEMEILVPENQLKSALMVINSIEFD